MQEFSAPKKKREIRRIKDHSKTKANPRHKVHIEVGHEKKPSKIIIIIIF